MTFQAFEQEEVETIRCYQIIVVESVVNTYESKSVPFNVERHLTKTIYGNVQSNEYSCLFITRFELHMCTRTKIKFPAIA